MYRLQKWYLSFTNSQYFSADIFHPPPTLQLNQQVRTKSLLTPLLIRNMIPMQQRYMIRTLLLFATIMLGWINIPAQALHLSDDQNLWPVMSQHFMIPDSTNHAGVQKQIDTDLRHPKYIHMLTKNARPYLYYVYQETEKKHLPAELALLPMIESNYIPYGYSNKGAVGLWQLMPSTANNYGVKMNSFYDGRRSTTVSTKVALSFLSYLYQQFNHNWLLALAAYNAGPGTVMAAIRYNEEHGRPTNFWALPLPRQTKEYIPKLLALAAIIQHPRTYGVNLAPVPNKPVTSTVTIKKQMPLKAIAHMANTSITVVKKLNPALRKQVTPPHQVLTLVLPANKKTTFVNKMEAQKAIQTVIAEKHFKKYAVQHGDSLSSIAKKFNTTIATLEKINQLQNEMIRIHQPLLVPGVATVAAKEISKSTSAAAKKGATTSPHTPKTTVKTAKKMVVTAKPKPATIQSNDGEHVYIVRPGDNLHRLAAEFHTTTYHIMEHNHLHTANLRIGEHLLLPNA